MEGNNIEEVIIEDENGDEDTMYKLIRTGSFRKLSCRTIHYKDSDEDITGEVIQYCHAKNISKEMSKYCLETRKLLINDDIDPFVKAAWIQWSFLVIHPFEDGNGRISRIISSLPLLKLNYPPIVIKTDNKHEYFECLQKAERDNDIMSLANFIAKSYEIAIDDILEMHRS